MKMSDERSGRKRGIAAIGIDLSARSGMKAKTGHSIGLRRLSRRPWIHTTSGSFLPTMQVGLLRQSAALHALEGSHHGNSQDSRVVPWVAHHAVVM